MSSTNGKLSTLFTPRHTFSQKLFFSAPVSLSVVPFSIDFFFPIVNLLSLSAARPVVQRSVLLRNADFSIVELCNVELASSAEDVLFFARPDSELSDLLSDAVPFDAVPFDAVPSDVELSDRVAVAEEIFCRISTTAASISL